MTTNNRTQLAYLSLLTIMLTGVACTQTSPPGPASTVNSQGAESTVDQVCKITAASLGVDLSRVTASTSLNELGADKLDFVELIMEIEEHFQIAIPDKVVENIAGTDIFQGDDIKKVTILELARIVDDQKK